MTRPAFAAALAAGPDGVLMALDATPGAREPGFPSGYDPWRTRIGIRVTAPAQDGRANEAICRSLADFFHLTVDRVVITKGAKSSHKTVRLMGATLDDVVSRLGERLE